MKIRSTFRLLILMPILAGIVLSFQNCSPVNFHSLETNEIESGSTEFCVSQPTSPLCVTPIQVKKCSFNGSEYSEGQTVTAYLASSVPAGQNCVSEERRCVDGAFTGSYSYSNCSVGSPAACLFSGRTIAHGDTVTAYQNSSVTFGETCVSETRVCDNGALSGSYNFETCSAGTAASCLFNGQTIAHGASVTAYVNSTVAYGSTCSPVMRTCNNGTLSGSGDFASCTPASPASCLFDGQTVPHGGTVRAFQSSSVAYGSTCAEQNRICNNGALSGSYSFASCAPSAPISCLFNGQTIAHGQSVTAYSASTVPFGSSCQSTLRTCNNGTLSGSGSFASCAPDAPASCIFNGQTIAHGQSVTAYQSATVPYGQTCAAQTRTCNNGSLSGSYGAPGCTYACVANQGQSCELETKYYWQSAHFDSLDACEVYKGNLGFMAPCPNPEAGYEWSGKLCRNDSAPTNGKWMARMLCAESRMGTVSCTGQCQ